MRAALICALPMICKSFSKTTMQKIYFQFNSRNYEVFPIVVLLKCVINMAFLQEANLTIKVIYVIGGIVQQRRISRKKKIVS